MKLKKFIFLFFVLLFAQINLVFSQAPEGDIVDLQLLDSQDTLITVTKYGNWWYGGFGGANLNTFVGNLRYDFFSQNPQFEQMIDYKGGDGVGFFVGLIGEYVPIKERWGYSLRLTAYDRVVFNTERTIEPGDIDFEYATEGVGTFINVAPSVRYNFQEEGFHIFSGLDFAIPISYAASQLKYFQNVGNIAEDRKADETDLNFRYGLHFGMGYDLILSDINSKYRAAFTPYVALQYMSSMISDNSSSYYSLGIRAGLALRFSKSRHEIDTLYFNPNYEAPPVYLASAGDEIGFEFSGFKREYDFLPAASIAFVEIAEIVEEIAVMDTSRIDEDIAIKEIQEDEKEEKPVVTPEPTRRTINVVPNVPFNFSFTNSASTSLTQEMRDYLDAVYERARSNPSAEIRIVGHSDDRGTLTQNTERSLQRAQNARIYLISKGLPPARVLATGVGSIDPIAPNNTEAGRRQNRRIVIQVVE